MRHRIRSCLIVIVLSTAHHVYGLTRWSNIDPAVIYSSTDPYEFLSVCGRIRLKDYCSDCNTKHIRLTVSPMGQFASKGKALEPKYTPAVPSTDFSTAKPPNNDADVELGDLKGPWNPIALFYDYCTIQNQEPCQNPRTNSTASKLITALDIGAIEGTPDGNTLQDYNRVCMSGPVAKINPAYQENNPPPNYPELGQFNLVVDPAGTDTKKLFGFYSVPIQYSKNGVRFEAEIGISDFTVSVKAGIVHMRQMPKFVEESCAATGRTCVSRGCNDTSSTTGCPGSPYTCCPPIHPTETTTSSTDNCVNQSCCLDWADCPCKGLVLNKIMKEQHKIAETLNVDIHTFDKTAAEDTELSLNWSHMFAVNKNSSDWPEFVFTPFASAGFTVPTGNKTDPCPGNPRHLFAISSGNDGHWSYGGRFGFTFDFVQTLAFGGEVGFTNFNKRDHIQYPLPTHRLQTGFFPLLGTVEIHPGLSWDFTAYIGAYHFIDRLSASAQYMGVIHGKDCFENIKVTGTTPLPDPAETILTEKLSAESAWRVHVINAALNYDLAHNLQIGLLWQIPIAQRNAYRTTTVMGTVAFTF